MHDQVLILSYYPVIFLVGLRKIAKNFNQDGRCPDLYSNRAIPNTRWRCYSLIQ